MEQWEYCSSGSGWRTRSSPPAGTSSRSGRWHGRVSVGWPESLSCRVDGGLTIISKVPAVDEVGEALVVAGAQDRRHADNAE